MTLKVGKWSDSKEELVKRITAIVGPDRHCPPFLESPRRKWVLNGTNDWFIEFYDGDEFELRYRYVWSDADWAALKRVIEKLCYLTE
jgi:hypothetical protein